jgi:hypothetical protein
MPPESLNTFLPGQRRPSESVVVPISSEENKPIFDFVSQPAIGAKQASSSPNATSLEASSLASSQAASLTERLELEPPIPTSAVLPPPITWVLPSRAPRLKTRQVWEGTVTEVHDGEFVAVLRDKTEPRNPAEVATFTFDNAEISAEDQNLIFPGSSFYWTIGTQQTPARQVINFSMIQFRRLPAWSQTRLSRAMERARQRRAEITGK